MNEFEKSVNRYLKDYADNGRAVIPWQDLAKYGFSGVWLRDTEESYRYRARQRGLKSISWESGRLICWRKLR